MMENPQMQQMIQSVMSNPAMMEMAVNSDPRMRAMIDANPHMRQILQNPQMLQVFTRCAVIPLPLTLFAVDDEPPVATRHEPGSAAGMTACAIFCPQSLSAAWLHSEFFSSFCFKFAFLDG
jgi:ubiquilin